MAQAPDLIVLGSHEPVGLARFRFQSIADRVVTGASCPVLLVPAAMKGVTPVFRSIVCAIDLSSRSSTMMASLARAASDAGRLAFLYVLRGRRRFRRVVVAASSAKALDASRQLHSLVDAQYSGSDVLVSVSSNSVPEEILRVARERDADLIVLGATRHSGLRRWFLGSTALRVSRRSVLPVLVLPAIHVKRESSTLEEAVLGWAA
jgi:nucleotide-binding universal stress UspA family protein